MHCYYVREVDTWRARKGRLSEGVRKRALERDGFSCVVCGAKNELEVHHITPPMNWTIW